MSRDEIQKLITDNAVVFFGKGKKGEPRCGFSAQVQKVLEDAYPGYVMINILADQQLREDMKEFSDWPTFPQVYVNGEFVGGCDIILEMCENGDLQKMLA